MSTKIYLQAFENKDGRMILADCNSEISSIEKIAKAMTGISLLFEDYCEKQGIVGVVPELFPDQLVRIYQRLLDNGSLIKLRLINNQEDVAQARKIYENYDVDPREVDGTIKPIQYVSDEQAKSGVGYWIIDLFNFREMCVRSKDVDSEDVIRKLCTPDADRLMKIYAKQIEVG